MKNKITAFLFILMMVFSLAPWYGALAAECVPVPPFVTCPGPSSSSGSGWSIGSIMGFGLPSATIGGIIEGILLWLLMMFGIIGVIGFLISGILYLVSAGDDKMIEKAKSGMKYSIIGVIVGLSGVVVIQAVDNMLGAWSF